MAVPPDLFLERAMNRRVQDCRKQKGRLESRPFQYFAG
jgi:hypothetical protein